MILRSEGVCRPKKTITKLIALVASQQTFVGLQDVLKSH